MARDRFSPRPLSDADAAPFGSAEAAWMWFWQCQIARDEGARYTANAGTVARPCDPDDIYRVAARLHADRVLDDRHARVLGQFGRALTPPDGRLSAEAAAATLWQQALGRLETPLRRKGIVG